jgi:hypothetical protein
MAFPTVEEAWFDMLPEEEGTGWLVRVSFVGEGFVDRAAPLSAKVGDVAVDAISVTGPDGAVGFLAEVPPGGARLLIGYLDTGLEETDITFPDPPIS